MEKDQILVKADRVMGYKAYCLGRSIGEAGNHYVVWKEGVLKTSNNL